MFYGRRSNSCVLVMPCCRVGDVVVKLRLVVKLVIDYRDDQIRKFFI